MPQTSAPRRRISVRAFLSAYTVTSAVLVAFTGFFLYFAARGNDVAMADWRFMRMTKWYLVDIHVVLAFALLIAAVLYGVARIAGRRRAEGVVLRLVWSAIGCAAALYTGWYVIGEHPVLIPDVRVTAHPASVVPDQVTLTWADDPTTTQAIQWRTSPIEGASQLRFRTASGADWTVVPAETSLLEDPDLANDVFNARHAVQLQGLTPATDYTYQVGHDGLWTEPAEFTTAGSTDTFSFVYMGDVQTGIEAWSALVQAADERDPDAAFYILAGDLVNKGCHRNEWDALFNSAGGVFAGKPLVPIIGNHDDCDEEGGPWMYLRMFDLPDNGPERIEPERAYSFTYGNALFVCLDSNLDPDTQTEWLEARLAESQATWKFVLLHHPAYSSKPHRDNKDIRKAWCPLFDKYGVDIAFQGHDHAYTRTYPLVDGEAVNDPNHGVNYVLSVAGDKYYEQEPRDFVQVAYTELSTYQVVQITGRHLTYRAYDIEGNVVDQLDLTK